MHRGWHDIGGVQTPDIFGPIDRSQHAYKWWEKQLDALPTFLIKKNLLNLHVFRKHIESLEPTVYASTTYFEKWAMSLTKCMLEKGVISHEELDKELGIDVPDTTENLFAVGARVTVLAEDIRTRWQKPHLRTPGYIFGKTGTVERICGTFQSPEFYAYLGRKASQQPLYRISFVLKDVWDKYNGNDADTIEIEIYQSWLKKADTTSNSSSSNVSDTKSHSQEHHSHDHSDDHSHEHEHEHEQYHKVEQNAVDAEGPESAFSLLAAALLRLLYAKNILKKQKVQRYIDFMDSLQEKPIGAKLVAKAWKNPTFKAELVKNPHEAAATMGISFEGTHIIVLENTPQVHNVVVCTLCSCYPKRLLGRPPDWYKSRSYRARTVIEPRKVLEEFGVSLPANVAVKTHDSTADMRYLVLPLPPKGFEELTEEELAKIVSRDSMVGVAVIPEIKKRS